jgi:hypothetical protein
MTFLIWLRRSLFDSAENLSFPVVAAIVRLGKKYDFKQLLTAAVARLTATFPRTLADARKPYHIIYRIYDDGGLLFDAINLATEAGLLALLPSLYFYALLELEDISSLVSFQSLLLPDLTCCSGYSTDWDGS